MRRGLPAVLGLLVMMGSLSACRRPEPVELGGVPGAYPPDAYERVHKRWTRRGLVLNQLDTALEAWSTFLSPDFRAAYAARYARDYRLPPAEAERFRALALVEAAAANEFFLATASTQPRWNDLEKKGSIWRIALVNDRGQELAPTQIKAHRTPPEPRTMVFFPYANVFTRTFTVKFPISGPDGTPVIHAGLRWFALRLSGPLGTTELRWQVRH